MPYTLRQLEGRRDACIKKIQEFKDSANERGGSDMGSLTFNSSAFFSCLVDMAKEDIDSFLSFFPQLPRILDIARQAAIEEKEEENLKWKLQNSGRKKK